MGVPDHLIYLLRNLYVGQEATKLDMEQQIGSKLGKEYDKAVYCLPAYLTYMQNALFILFYFILFIELICRPFRHSLLWVAHKHVIKTINIK